MLTYQKTKFLHYFDVQPPIWCFFVNTDKIYIFFMFKERNLTIVSFLYNIYIQEFWIMFLIHTRNSIFWWVKMLRNSKCQIKDESFIRMYFFIWCRCQYTTYIHIQLVVKIFVAIFVHAYIHTKLVLLNHNTYITYSIIYDW